MSLKQLTNTDRLWKDFVDYIEDRVAHHHKQLSVSEEPVEIYRHQGAIRELNRLKQLDKEVNGQEKKSY